MSLSSAVSAPASQAVALYSEHLPALDDGREVTSKEGLWRLLSTTMAILNHAHSELDAAHYEVQELQSRIIELESQNTTDLVTGLKNRRGFEEAFAQELDRVNRGQSKGGIMVLIDLDNFKAINDTHSHLAGDAALKLVGEALMQEIRTMDTAARLGGDEFVLLLSNARKEDILARIQTMASRLNKLSLVWYGSEISVRGSIGIKDFKKGDDPAAIFRAADSAMYMDKANNISRASAKARATGVNLGKQLDFERSKDIQFA